MEKCRNVIIILAALLLPLACGTTSSVNEVQEEMSVSEQIAESSIAGQGDETASAIMEAPTDTRGKPDLDIGRDAVSMIQAALGVELAIAESYIRRSIISTKTPYGFKISAVKKGSAGDRAGWRKGDLIMEWDGQPVKSVTELSNWLAVVEDGARVPFELARRKSDVTLLSRDPWESVRGEVMPAGE